MLSENLLALRGRLAEYERAGCELAPEAVAGILAIIDAAVEDALALERRIAPTNVVDGRFGLTAVQRQALDFIAARIALDGVSPSYREIGAALGLKNMSRVCAIVRALVERGYVRHLTRSRSIRLVEP